MKRDKRQAPSSSMDIPAHYSFSSIHLSLYAIMGETASSFQDWLSL